VDILARLVTHPRFPPLSRELGHIYASQGQIMALARAILLAEVFIQGYLAQTEQPPLPRTPIGP